VEQRIAWARASGGRTCIVIRVDGIEVIARHFSGPIYRQPRAEFEGIWRPTRLVGDGAQPDDLFPGPWTREHG
jgi:hypothetical protein